MRKFWLVKNKKGEIQGPYTEMEICSHIENGNFHRETKISLYPSGNWLPISSHLPFYDKISNLNIQSSKKEKKEETVSGEYENEDFELEKEESEEVVLEPTIVMPRKFFKRKVKVQFAKIERERERDDEVFEDEEDIVDMEESGLENILSRFKSILFPLIISISLIGITTFSIISYLKHFSKRKSGSNYIRLQYFSKKRNNLKKEDLKKKIIKAKSFYFRGNVSDYVKSQNEWIQILENKPKYLFAYSQLCLVYLELWPFSYQDSKDRKTFYKTLTRIKKIDDRQFHSGICSIVDNLISEEYEKAFLTINSQLNTVSSDEEKIAIFLYYLKAKVLENLQKTNEVKNYLRTIYNLSPKWTAPYLLEGKLLYDGGDFSGATKMYQKVLSIFPDHFEANLRLGIIEYIYFKKISKSKKRLKKMLVDNSEITTPSVLAKAYEILARIFVQEQNKSSAIKYAKKSYAINSSDKYIIQLIDDLGGEKLIQNTKIQTRQFIYKGDQLALERKFVEAKEYYKKAYDEDKGKNVLAAIKLAKNFKQMGISSQAIYWLKKAISTDPHLAEAYFLSVDYLSENYLFDQAIHILNIAQKKHLNDYEIFKAYALLSLRQKNYKSAIAYGKRALKFYDADAETYVILSEAYRRLEKYNESFQHANNALIEDPNNTNAEINYALAIGFSQGFNKGVEYFEKLIQNFPYNMEYKQALGEYYFTNERYQEAKNEFRMIILHEPDYKLAYIYLGRIYSFFSERDKRPSYFQKALSHFLRAINLDPSDTKSIFYMGRAYMQNKDYENAKNQFEKVLRLNFNYPLIHYYVGRTYFLMGRKIDLKKALNFAKTEIEKNPKLSSGYILAGDVYQKQKQYELCAGEYQKALEFRSRDIELYIKLIICYRKSGNLDLALKLIQQIVTEEGKSGYPELHRQLGLIYEIKGDYIRAKKAYDNYFNLSPRAFDKVKIKKRLKTYFIK